MHGAKLLELRILYPETILALEIFKLQNFQNAHKIFPGYLREIFRCESTFTRGVTRLRPITGPVYMEADPVFGDRKTVA